MTDDLDRTPESEATPAFEPATATVPPAPIGERFVDVFTAPVKAMTAVIERPAWVIPFLVLFTLMMLYTMTNVHIMVPEQTEMSMAHVSGEQAAAMEAQIEMFTDPPVWLRVLAGIGAGLTVAVFSLMLPGLLMHLFLKLSGGVATASQSLGVVFWAALIPYGLRTILGWIVIAVTGSAKYAGLAATSLLPDPNPQSVSYVIAGLYGDPFMYWMLAVTVIGMTLVHKVDMAKSATVVVATYVLLTAIPIAFTLLGQVMAGR